MRQLFEKSSVTATLAIPAVVDAIYGLWDGIPIHAGHPATVCGPGGRHAGVEQPRLADPRCWACLAWLSEDKESISVPTFAGDDLLPAEFEGEDRDDLVAALRKRIATGA